jgi:hypothetical protein
MPQREALNTTFVLSSNGANGNNKHYKAKFRVSGFLEECKNNLPFQKRGDGMKLRSFVN